MSEKALPKVVYLSESKFRDAMLSLRRRGGAHQRAYEKACRLITSLSYGLDELNSLTNHGESRIKHCRKYDLSNDAHRLVTVHTEGYIYLLHVGTHDEVDRWLDHSRGLTITAHTDTKKIQVTFVTSSEEAWRHALRLYVAMTRGRDQVALVYSDAPSKFLEVMRPDLEWQEQGL